MRKIEGYLCAAVRGKDGDSVSQEKKWANITIAKQVGFEIRRKFPDLDLYVPHEHEEFLEVLMEEGVTSKTALKAMCRLAAKRDILFVYSGNGVGEGMVLEMEAVKKAGKEIIIFNELSESSEAEIAKTIYLLLEKMSKEIEI